MELLAKLINWILFNIAIAIFPIGFNVFKIHTSSRNPIGFKVFKIRKFFYNQQKASPIHVMNTSPSAWELALGNGELFLISVAINADAMGSLMSVYKEEKIISLVKLLGVGFGLLLILALTACFYENYSNNNNNNFNSVNQSAKKNAITSLNILNEDSHNNEIKKTARYSSRLFLISFLFSGFCKIIEVIFN